MQYSPERKYEQDGAVYIIRDVLQDDGAFAGSCEYAVKSDTGQVRWAACREGVQFNEIEPFEYVMPAKRNWVV